MLEVHFGQLTVIFARPPGLDFWRDYAGSWAFGLWPWYPPGSAVGPSRSS